MPTDQHKSWFLLSPASILLCALTCSAATPTAPTPAPKPLTVVVVGGIALCGVWDRLAPRIEAATGVKLDTVSTQNKEGIIPEFKAGKADLLLVHGGEETFQLQAEGIGGQQRVWGFNDHVIVGPANDPAGVATAPNAGVAFQRMAATHSPFVAFRDPGSHAMVQKLWKRIGLKASSDWVVLDETADPHEILNFAAQRHAYVVVGHVPVVFGKLNAEGMKILLKGDPALRKAYVVMEPGERHSATPLAREQARKVADYLVSPEGQATLVAADREANGPWVFPLSSAREAQPGQNRPGAGQGGGGGDGSERKPRGAE